MHTTSTQVMNYHKNMPPIYLDNNATTPLDPLVREVIEECLRNIHGNASSIHAYGRRARVAIENAREEIASLLGALSHEMYFTSGGTEANNLAIQGIYLKEKNRGNHIITTRVEHPSILATMKYLEKEGALVTYLPVDNAGRITIHELQEAITDKTILISVMLANNEIGNIYPLKKISQIAHAKNILVHTDAVQAVGKIPVNIPNIGVDVLSLSAHKFYGPKGIGALYIKQGLSIEPIMHGGGQERAIRPGTENTAAITGFGKAAELIRAHLSQEMERIFNMRKKLERGILEKIPDAHIYGELDHRIPGTLNVGFTHIEGEALLLNLDLAQIAVSSGSACSSGSLDPSPVLLALGLSQQEAKSAIRMSLGRFNTEEEIDFVLEALPTIITRLKDVY